MPKKRGSEIQIARGRLKGVLQELVAVSDEDVSDESEKKYHIPQRGRPPKKLKKEILDISGPLHESFVMKLFDRSLDLAKYKETTPLYPICRAWIANQPRSSAIKNLRNDRTPSPEIREKAGDLIDKLTSGQITEISSLPAPKPLDIPRIPSPLPEQKEVNKDNIKLDYDVDNPSMSMPDIQAEHHKRWVKVRNKWNSQSKAYQQRHSPGGSLSHFREKIQKVTTQVSLMPAH